MRISELRSLSIPSLTLLSWGTHKSIINPHLFDLSFFGINPNGFMYTHLSNSRDATATLFSCISQDKYSFLSWGCSKADGMFVELVCSFASLSKPIQKPSFTPATMYCAKLLCR